MAVPVPATPAAPAVCPRCRQPLELAGLVSGLVLCPACRREFEAVRFDPPQPRLRVVEMSAAGPDASTACAEHPGNAAVANCGRCGVFMCALCATDADGMSVCPACFDRLSAEGTVSSAQTKFRDYEVMASSAALASYFLCFAGVVLGPAAIYYGVKALRQKREWGDEGGRASIWVSMVFGGLAAIVGGAYLVVILGGVFRR